VIKNLINRIASIGSRPGDSEDLRLQKSTLMVVAFPFMVVPVLWGVMYFYFGVPQAGLIPLAYAVISFFTLMHFALTGNVKIFRFGQLALILVLPFFVQLVLGGFVGSGAVILWSLISPLGALMFGKLKHAPRWIIAFVLLVVLSIPLPHYLDIPIQLTAGQIQLFFLINFLGVGVLVFVMMYYFVGKRNFFQARADALLLNILPEEIAAELKTHGKAVAKHFDDVTVMFTDFKDFTRIAEQMRPADLVESLDTCFNAFDTIISQYAIEKIKTIGDSYMVAAGLPVSSKTHAVDMVSAALEMLDFMRAYTANGKHPAFEIRIGIHSGPVVAGIVGSSKFAYDIWGDTVNIASRMESSGEAGKINISGSTYALVKDRYPCAYRGKLEAKNKGEIDMYFIDFGVTPGGSS
jgi:adenylate cyclase